MDANEGDFLARVMRRPVGGSSSCETSPEKRPEKISVQQLNPNSPYSDLSNTNDEVDGFAEVEMDMDERFNTEDQSEVKENDQIAKKVETKKKYILDIDFELVGRKESSGTSHTSEETSLISKPLIEMFNESDSNSNSNSFILASFRSLNENTENHSDEILRKKDDEENLHVVGEAKNEICSINTDNKKDETESGKFDDYKYCLGIEPEFKMKEEIDSKTDSYINSEHENEFELMSKPKSLTHRNRSENYHVNIGSRGIDIGSEHMNMGSEHVNIKHEIEDIKSELDTNRSENMNMESEHKNIKPELENVESEPVTIRSEHKKIKSDSGNIGSKHKKLESDSGYIGSEYSKIESEDFVDRSEHIRLKSELENIESKQMNLENENQISESEHVSWEEKQQNEHENDASITNTEESQTNFSETEVSEQDINPWVFENNDNEVNSLSEDEERFTNTENESLDKIEQETTDRKRSKKSRKQCVPKRVRKTELSEIELSKNFGDSEVEVDGVGNQDNVVESRLNESLNSEANQIKRSEKSRKQCKPSRIKQLQEYNGNSLENDGFGTQSGFHGNVGDVESNYRYLGLKTVEAETNMSANDAILVESLVKDEKKTDHIIKEVYEERANSNLQTENSEGNFNPLTSLNISPLCYGLPKSLNLISGLSPGLVQGLSPTAGNFTLTENGPENLEVIRQIREIRCNRYRKISIAEKQEIAGYASVHGVSQAAAYYNVSKSAVSMWTKLDFSNTKDDSRYKKNCLLGNEKFQALCQRIKNEKETKFKNMSKQDKFEVSRYAKLVGVREMARCVDVALGTVSGWMRQFPYKVDGDTSDAQTSDDSNSKKNIRNKESDFDDKLNKSSHKRKVSETVSNCIKKKRKSKPIENEANLYKTVEVSDTMYILPKIEMDDKKPAYDTDKSNDSDMSSNDERFEGAFEGRKDEYTSDSEKTPQLKDEVDELIEQTMQSPDFEKCYEDIKDLIKDSPLEGDEFFRSLFERVVACKAMKYKTLKPSEKLEVVRYSKQIGVRKVAKILGLATGTLSGWNTKYQACLGSTDPNIDVTNKNDLLVSFLSTEKSVDSLDSSLNGNNSGTPGPTPDSSEVTAVKLLFKDKFQELLDKIVIAKQVKFRNISTDEKIEFVKCSKLVGIRPTARVFNIPIGTLSGWITKYTKMLHPAYHVDVDNDSGGNSQDSFVSSPRIGTGAYSPSVVGRAAAPSNLHTGMVDGFTTPNSAGLSLNLFPAFSPSLSSSSLLTSLSTVSSSSLGSLPTSSTSSSSSDMNRAESYVNSNQSEDNFEEEAKQLALQYLTAAR